MSVKYRGDTDDMYEVAMGNWHKLVGSQGKFLMAEVVGWAARNSYMARCQRKHATL